MNEEQQQIYMDKIKLGMVLLAKELDISQYFNFLHSQMKRGMYDPKQIEFYEEYGLVWQNVAMLYDVLEHQYMDKLRKKDKQIAQELDDSMVRYRSDKDKINYNDLKMAVFGIHKLMALTGFHNLLRDSDLDLDLRSTV